MYRINYSPAVKRDLKRLPMDVQDHVRNALDEIVDNPYEHVKKLKTSSNSPIFSYRIGSYRVIISIYDFELIILVLEVGDRKNIYRKF
ncbi:type II toxin-antitoxin system RelE family toxin [Methanosarcina horonobensis]|uniref:type II toxin-antitoxin system RelE family toxin n=1 Tax=Methanosarcina horonobensis TaxID=418008 RepID=UPI00064E4CE0|nr:type II toxin-antitoxin system RelE/ParE family toxin [Methanosarcina horonobensis]